MHWAVFGYLCLFAILIVAGLWHDLKNRQDCRLSVLVALAELLVLGLATGRHVAELLPRWLGLALIAVAVVLTVLDFRREAIELSKEEDFDPRGLACLNVAVPVLLLPAYWLAVTNVLAD